MTCCVLKSDEDVECEMGVVAVVAGIGVGVGVAAGVACDGIVSVVTELMGSKSGFIARTDVVADDDADVIADDDETSGVVAADDDDVIADDDDGNVGGEKVVGCCCCCLGVSCKVKEGSVMSSRLIRPLSIWRLRHVLKRFLTELSVLCVVVLQLLLLFVFVSH